MTSYNTYTSAEQVPAHEIEKLRTDPKHTVHVITKKGASRYVKGEFLKTWNNEERKWNEPEFKRFTMWDGRKWQGLTDELAQAFDPELHAIRQERKAKRRNKMNKAHAIELGAIFYTSWGYEQTNIEWFEVVKTTAKTVTLRRIAGAREYCGAMDGYTKPCPGSYVDDFKFDDDENANGIRRIVKNYGWGNEDSWSCKIDEVRHAHLWDGKPKHFSEWY